MPRNDTARLALVVAALVVSVRPSHARPVGASTDACRSFSSQMLSSCRAETQADFQRALASCTNITNPGQKQGCQRDAAAAQTDASVLCNAQYDARLDACRRLGGGAYDPTIRSSDFVDVIDNPYFPLTPGTTYTYRTTGGSGTEIDVVTVTHRTRDIDGVTCIEVHDVSTIDGAVAEDTFDWYAQDKDGNVWYFGEATTQLEDGFITGTEGSWLSGVDGAKAGIIMKADPRVGESYRQEFLPGTAEDIARVASTNGAASVPYGSFSGCVQTDDTSPLEPDVVEQKFYAAGVGSVLEIDLSTGERLELLSVTTE